MKTILALALVLFAGCATQGLVGDGVEPSPSPSPAPLAQLCEMASDCTGILRPECIKCADGTQKCAHFECEAGACAVVTCE